jgi:hypothetical protein
VRTPEHSFGWVVQVEWAGTVQTVGQRYRLPETPSEAPGGAHRWWGSYSATSRHGLNSVGMFAALVHAMALASPPTPPAPFLAPAAPTLIITLAATMRFTTAPRARQRRPDSDITFPIPVVRRRHPRRCAAALARPDVSPPS